MSRNDMCHPWTVHGGDMHRILHVYGVSRDSLRYRTRFCESRHIAVIHREESTEDSS